MKKKNDGDSDSATSASSSSRRRKTSAESLKKTRVQNDDLKNDSSVSKSSRRKKSDPELVTKAGVESGDSKRRSPRVGKARKAVASTRRGNGSSSVEMVDDSCFIDLSQSVDSFQRQVVVEYDMNAVNARIAAVPLSDREIARRSALKQSNSRCDLRGHESVFSAPLPKWNPGWLIVQGARKHNLKSITAPFPLSAFTVVTGVSGSGKSSLVQDVLYASVVRELNRSVTPNRACDGILGCEQLRSVIQVDQSPIGQTATSNPATYTGLFDLIRNLYAQLPESKIRGFTPRQFSFNVPGGRCEKCEGAGMIKVEMHFLADVWIVCDACGGKRYNSETLKVKYLGKSISEILETTCGDALELFHQSRSISRILKTLCDVGLDYLPLGQSATTLSGGEAQRVKLAAELSRIDSGRTLYILDEPTTGLHFEDVRKLLDVLHRLVDLGNTIVVVEHNLDVVKNADWILEIGPEAGLDGGNLVFAGTPEQLLEYTAKRSSSPELERVMARSYTGEALFPVFRDGVFYERPMLDVQGYWKSIKDEEAKRSEESISSTASETTLSPWEVDGRRWHTELRLTPSGAVCRWDPHILTSIVDRLISSFDSLSDNWSARTFVEVVTKDAEETWFLKATTTDEWLLELRFRTRKRSFDRELLIQKLALRTLNDMEEIPLFGTQPRVRVETVGPWQEIEIKAFSFSEIDVPEFWSFLDLAAKNFIDQVNGDCKDIQNLTPWKSQGRDWHFSRLGFYGDSSNQKWSFELLEKVIDVVLAADPSTKVDWRQKINVVFNDGKSGVCWAQVFTKNVDFICVQIVVAKKSILQESANDLGYKPEYDASDPNSDSFFIRYRSEEDFDGLALQRFLENAAKFRIKG